MQYDDRQRQQITAVLNDHPEWSDPDDALHRMGVHNELARRHFSEPTFSYAAIEAVMRERV